MESLQTFIGGGINWLRTDFNNGKASLDDILAAAAGWEEVSDQYANPQDVQAHIERLFLLALEAEHKLQNNNLGVNMETMNNNEGPQSFSDAFERAEKQAEMARLNDPNRAQGIFAQALQYELELFYEQNPC